MSAAAETKPVVVPQKKEGVDAKGFLAGTASGVAKVRTPPASITTLF
jgi:hypothetical protein